MGSKLFKSLGFLRSHWAEDILW